MCRLHLFVLDSHLATFRESNCPFGFSASDVSIRVQLFRVCVSFPLMSLMGGVG